MIYRLIVVRDINGLRRELYKKKLKENQTTWDYGKDKTTVLDWSKGFIWATKKNVGYLMLDIDKGQLSVSEPLNKIQIDASYETNVAVGKGILKNVFAALVSTSSGTLPIVVGIMIALAFFFVGLFIGNIEPITAIQNAFAHFKLPW
jgi:hypothetical protein